MIDALMCAGGIRVKGMPYLRVQLRRGRTTVPTNERVSGDIVHARSE